MHSSECQVAQYLIIDWTEVYAITLGEGGKKKKKVTSHNDAEQILGGML